LLRVRLRGVAAVRSKMPRSAEAQHKTCGMRHMRPDATAA
jgi:hypothetical protein